MVFDILLQGGRTCANAQTTLEIDHNAASLLEWLRLQFFAINLEKSADRLVKDGATG